MKIIYEKSILEQLRAARTDALRQQKVIEKVQLTVFEARALTEALGVGAWSVGVHSEFERWLAELECCGSTRTPQPLNTVLGMKIEVVK